MSDHDAPFDPMTPNPMDRAYAQAEAVLSDEAARAARRARVLAAVAGEAAAADVQPSPPVRRPAWRRGGWLVAAGVAGLGVFLASQLYLPSLGPRPIAPPTPAVPAARDVAPPPAPAPSPAARKAEPAAQAVRESRRAAPPPDRQRFERAPTLAPSPLLPLPPPPIEVAKAAPAAAPASSAGISEIVVTGSRIPSATLSARIRPAAGSPADRAERLRDAAAAGRTAEVAALLAAKGVAVDATDGAGETALMKAVQANQPAAAALLRRHGASLDLKNHAGVSARDMATAIGDAELNRALGLGP